MRLPRVIMVYPEPTPYITALVETLRRSWSGPIEAHYIMTDRSQPWHLQLDNEHGSLLSGGFLAQVQALRRALAGDRRHTILHLAGWGHPVLVTALLTARCMGIPVAVESDTASGSLDPLRIWVKKLTYPLLFRVASRFLPGGTRQARYLAQYGVKTDRMTVVHMTVDVCAIRQFCANDRKAMRAAARARWGMSADECIVLFVGRLEEHKGVKLLLSAFQRAAGKERDLRLAIVGSGSLATHVAAVAAEADRRVNYLGRLFGDDVLRAYLAADFLVLPSLFEPWGLVVNEAMACGLPVIVSDRVGCADDLVRPGETGLIVAAGDDGQLAAAIRRLAGDAGGRERMGQAAELLMSNWTLEHEAQNVASAWREIAR